ncbi:kinase-like protein [Exidia glandulosa HHB12029]|uniref:Kinase-like protein n=1 Tax=Exidia glandulosa HHB12029 TaxID=1314781 RepID=A0A165J1D7_EXIGL|nr:kinase-like protein [Exidia glandulosa HHB12029]
MALPSWSDISDLSDDALREHCDSPNLPALATAGVNGAENHVRRIARDAVAKWPYSTEPETEAMRLARAQTDVPVPAVLRFAPDGLLVSEYVNGRPLSACWTGLSLWRKVAIVWTLRGYVRQLRSVFPPGPLFPGPVAREPQTCLGVYFTVYGAGPFATHQELADWYDHKLDVSRRVKKIPQGVPTFDRSQPLVFTHLDFKPRNILLDENNVVWLIDWGLAGFYPRHMEYAAMVGSWKVLLGHWLGYYVAGFIAGFYDRQRQFFDTISWGLTTGSLL